MSEKATVFVVDDDEAVRDSLHRLFQSAGVEVRSFSSGEEFLRDCDPGRGDCLIVDVRMPGMSGLELQKEVAARAKDLPVIVITGHGDAESEQQAMEAGAVAFLHKPFRNQILLETVEKAVAGKTEA